MRLCRFDRGTIIRDGEYEGTQELVEAAGLLLESSILCWNFLIGTFTIQQWRSHVIFHSTFLVRVCQFPMGKKNSNRAAGLLNQGRRVVAGLK